MRTMSNHTERRKSVGTNGLRNTGGVVTALVLMAALLLLWPGSAFAVDLVVDADTYISAASTNDKSTNFGSNPNLQINSTQTTFMDFDFSSLPCGLTGANIQKATLTAFVSNVATAGTYNIRTVN